MRIAMAKQVLLLRMPATDLGALCFLPEMRQFVARFPGQVKVNLATEPSFLALSQQVVPLVMAVSSEAAVLCQVQRSLRQFLPPHSNLIG
jgi:hypothetical protein